MSDDVLLDFGQAYRKAADYCAAQDRCISELRLKLKLWKTDNRDIPAVINKLIAEDFVNEKRFAVNYARGKFRINGWGKVKISAHLRSRSIPSELIKHALSLIETDEYNLFLENLLLKKCRQLGEDTPENRQKAAFFAASRGFEQGLITSVLNTLKSFDI